jgi:hypothetical protein
MNRFSDNLDHAIIDLMLDRAYRAERLANWTVLGGLVIVGLAIVSASVFM